MTDRRPLAANVADSLSMAMVASSDVPLLLLDGDLQVIAVSRSFCRAFSIEQADATGKSVLSLGAGEWNLPRLGSLLSATVSGIAAIEAYELDLAVPGQAPRRLVVKAEKLEYGAVDPTRLLVTVSDVTEARIAERLKDDLLRDKAILLQEIQHRVANSLQIIASVLMQSARTVQSEESRMHLSDAHNRVMSIATLQKQLSESHSKDVILLPYFTQLCHSLGASMIRDHNKQSIEVTGDDSVVGADVSVSLGLIVTELVINALKHAFPDGRPGKIWVDYESKGPNWTLSVDDNGVGMPKDPADAAAGLGTSIVEALARQLHASVRIADRSPGTGISVGHNQLIAVDAVERAL